MSNIDLGTIWLMAAFILMFGGFFFRWLRGKLSPVFSYYDNQIAGVKLLYHYLEFFPYEQTEQDKEIFARSFNHYYHLKGNDIQESINLLSTLVRNIYHKENLKNVIIRFMHYFAPPKNSNGLIFPVFKSNVEFLQKKKEIKKLSDIMIKYLENNIVN